MLECYLLAFHPLPVPVQQGLHLAPRNQQPGAPAVTCLDGPSGLSWLVHQRSLLLWQFESPSAATKEAVLPSKVEQGCHVQVVQHNARAVNTLAMCHGTGTVHAWMDVNDLSGPLACQALPKVPGVSRRVTALAVASVPGQSGPEFLAAVGDTLGGLQFLHGSASGVFVAQREDGEAAQGQSAACWAPCWT